MSGPVETIAADDLLYRRFFQYYIKSSGEVSSAAFKDKKGRPDPELSVDLARLTTPERCLSLGQPGMRLGQLKAAVPLSLGLSIVHSPVADNYAHCLMIGNPTKQICRLLAEATTVVACELP